MSGGPRLSVPLCDRQTSFFDISFLTQNLFDGHDPYSLFRQKVLPTLEARRDKLRAMYCATNGRPALDPVLVAGVTLVYFRQRLLEHQQGRVAFDALLQGLQQEGLIARRGQQQLDSTHILGQVAQMSRLEKTPETVRLFLEMLERAGRPRELPDGAAWRERYLDSEVLWHKLSQEALAAKFQQTGQDMQGLLTWVADHQDLLTHAKTQLLGRVFGEQFEVTAPGPAGRKQEDSGTVQNSHDLRSDCRRNPADSPGIREAIQLRSARYRGGFACQWAA